MKLKKIRANSMPEAVQKIHQELGTDAVILNSKKIKTGGFLGMFKKTAIEVVAAIDRKTSSHSPVNQSTIHHSKMIEKNRMDDAVVTDSSYTANAAVIEEINELKRMMLQQQNTSTGNDFVYPYRDLYDRLVEQEVTEELSKEVVTHLQTVYRTEDVSDAFLLDQAREFMIERLATKEMTDLPLTQKIIHFVGPTGVGKTTTLAKLAAKYSLGQGKKVAFITSDTYRIAAVDQLRTYAKILDIPMEVAYSKEDYDRAIESFHSYDLILVDTAGRNYRDNRYIEELKNLVSFDEQSAIYLVLSTTAKHKDIIEIYEQFASIPLTALIMTKTDETIRYGSLYNLPIISQKSVLYITNGQDVPDDLIEVKNEQIVDMILGATDE